MLLIGFGNADAVILNADDDLVFTAGEIKQDFAFFARILDRVREQIKDGLPEQLRIDGSTAAIAAALEDDRMI